MNWPGIIPDRLEWKLIAYPTAGLTAGEMNKMF